MKIPDNEKVKIWYVDKFVTDSINALRKVNCEHIWDNYAHSFKCTKCDLYLGDTIEFLGKLKKNKMKPMEGENND